MRELHGAIAPGDASRRESNLGGSTINLATIYVFTQFALLVLTIALALAVDRFVVLTPAGSGLYQVN